MDTALTWSNRDNAVFYQKMPIDAFVRQSAVCGLDQCCDVKAAMHYLQDASSILEICCGYGRVLDFLQASHVKGKLFGLERNSALCQRLKKNGMEK